MGYTIVPKLLHWPLNCSKEGFTWEWALARNTMVYWNGYKIVNCWQDNRIQSSRSTSSERFIFAVIVENINLFCRRSGMGNSILRSSLPGRSRAGSNVSWRFVAIITYKRCNSLLSWLHKLNVSHLDIYCLIKPVHLVQKLQQNTLHLSIGCELRQVTVNNIIVDLCERSQTHYQQLGNNFKLVFSIIAYGCFWQHNEGHGQD